jgi:hypothetical protein
MMKVLPNREKKNKTLPLFSLTYPMGKLAQKNRQTENYGANVSAINAIQASD